jgi:FKBP-type peptidyl-prolyl cis-trans isomerase FkpA
MKYILPLLFLGIFLNSCAKKKAEKQALKDDEIIQSYLSSHNLTATKTNSGLYYVMDFPGTGQSCVSTSNVKVSYKGYFTDGKIFDESPSAGVTFNLKNVITGWTEGIPYFKEGGLGKLLLPSALAYGKNGTSGIPENSVLIFDIHLIQVL